MKIWKYLLAAALIVMFSGVPVFAADEDGTMSADDMGDGAEYSSGDDRALEIDEAGDGDYESGDGSVVESGSSGVESSGEEGE